MNTDWWKRLSRAIVLILLAASLAACRSTATSVPTTEAFTQQPVEAPTEESIAVGPVTLRIGVTTIWDAMNPATGWESYNIR